MKLTAFMVRDAEEDLLDIYRYALRSHSYDSAEKVYKTIRMTCGDLVKMPFTGHVPPELERVGVLEYREVGCYPYRIIYRVVGERLLIHCILDGRRNLMDLLHRRLIR
ncbi:MAG: type II toxin-antitoxin system RelE/ParE family toxin [Candidatus Sabulitectum sp.]|nr:type II toxin-antitoxin system RelE/ParE family toxin [Candidatus Sabulitectum sp.]